jgi:hypothetical protein
MFIPYQIQMDPCHLITKSDFSYTTKFVGVNLRSKDHLKGREFFPCLHAALYKEGRATKHLI